MTTYRKLFFGLQIRKETVHSNGYGILKSWWWVLEKDEGTQMLAEFCVTKVKEMHARLGFEICGGRAYYPTIRLSLWRYEVSLTIMDLFNE
jgi:hypothetical protein